jgi:SAM-dependent methyltransferase
MEKEQQERWNKLVSDHWWIRGHHLIARRLIEQYISQKKGDVRSLDVGCSGGYAAGFLKRFGRTCGFDLSYDAVMHSDNKDGGIIQADALNIPFRDKSFDAVLVLEVAEHVQDDHLLFREINRVCRKSALIFVMVPAHRWLWGSHDVFYLHKKRYSRKEFVEIMESCGFKVLKLSFMHPHLLLPLFFMRLFDRLRPGSMGRRDDFLSLGTLVDRLLYGTLVLEDKLIRRFNLPFGICLFGVFTKDE